MNHILIQTDESCEMQSVSLNGDCIQEGNYWDFHPGCHGIYEYGNYKGADGLASAIRDVLTVKGESCQIEREDYKYLDYL